MARMNGKLNLNVIFTFVQPIWNSVVDDAGYSIICHTKRLIGAWSQAIVYVVIVDDDHRVTFGSELCVVHERPFYIVHFMRQRNTFTI